MESIKITNETSYSYKIKDTSTNRIYRLPKESQIEIEITENTTSLEIIDHSFYDAKSLLKLILTFIVLFIPYIIASIIGIDNMWYSLRIPIKDNTKVIRILEDSKKKISFKGDDKVLDYSVVKGKSLLMGLALIGISLLFYASIVLIILIIV